MALRIALFGQAPFGKDVLLRLQAAGHEIAAVYTPPEEKRPDPLAEVAREKGLRLIQHKRFRKRGEALPERLEEFASLGVELNVLAFVTVILPSEILDAPQYRSLCFHPSLLPRFRGGSAIPWQIILGEQEAGVTVFRPDEGIDTGPIAVQKGGVLISPEDTAASLYFNKLYPLGVDAVAEAVDQVARGAQQLRDQDESKASFQGLLNDEIAQIDWDQPASELDRLIRGCDPQPGAHTLWRDQRLRLYGAKLVSHQQEKPPGTVLGLHEGCLHIAALGGELSVAKLRVGDQAKCAAQDAGISAGERFG